MSTKSYSVYCDQNVDFLGLVPQHWGISRLGFETWVRARLGWKGLKAEEYVDDGYVFLATPNIKGRDIDFKNVNYITKERYEESPEIMLREDDVLLAKDGSTLGTVNVVRALPRSATVNSSLAVISPGKRVSGVFLYYLFQSSYLSATIQRIKGGMGVPHLFQDDLTKFYLPLPPLLEQSAIVAFLDRETAKIDALIAEQERLIALLQEKRQAVISQAVTTGLDLTTPMEDSGVEWLGKVPKHWRVGRIRDFCHSISTGPFGTALGSADYVEEGIPVINPSHLQDGVCAPDRSVSVSSETAGRLSYWALQVGDLVVARRGELGRAAVISDKEEGWICGTGSLRVTPDPANLASRYLYSVLQSHYARAWLDRASVGSTMPNLNEALVGRLPIALPPTVVEQEAILVRLAESEGRISELIADVRRGSMILKERRAALISAAVTGKMDVRDTVAIEPAAA